MLTLLEVLDVPGGQGDPDLVDLGAGGSTGLLEIVLGGHCCSDSDLLLFVGGKGLGDSGDCLQRLVKKKSREARVRV